MKDSAEGSDNNSLHSVDGKECAMIRKCEIVSGSSRRSDRLAKMVDVLRHLKFRSGLPELFSGAAGWFEPVCISGRRTDLLKETVDVLRHLKLRGGPPELNSG